MASHHPRINLPLEQRVRLLTAYGANRLWEQAKAFLPVVLYLGAFQILVLGQGLEETGILILGILAAILGLTFFMEGLFLTFMPLGESLGIGLPLQWPLPMVLGFSLVLGAAATFAEPAVGILKAAGSTVLPWEAPLLYYVLNTQSVYLILVIALGVGVAVALGMMRLLFGWTLKTILLILFPPILLLTIISALHPLLSPLVGLAWDSGGITTGPVTVPLVLALGIGVSRIASKDEEDNGGFGIVTLASILPVVAVLFLGWGLYFFQVPELSGPVSAADFFAPAHQDMSMKILGSEENYFHQAARAGIPLAQAPEITSSTQVPGESGFSWLYQLLFRQMGASFQAVVPLTLFLILVSFLAIREKIRFLDEKFLGILFAFLGMVLFSSGIETGLTRLGSQVGKTLPASFQKLEIPDRSQVWQDVEPDDVKKVFDAQGNHKPYLLQDNKGIPELVAFDPTRYDEVNKTYLHIPTLGPLFGTGPLGLILVLLFGFLMGYGATLAEPALLAMSRTVEDVTVGVISRSQLTQAVALGVGVGIVLGFGKILWNLPLGLILPGIYVVLLILTLFSKEDFVNIAFDSAGVTTGPVTVPLVVVIGLSLGSRVGVMDGFGVLATASAFPILFVLLLGLWSRAKAKKVQG